MGLGTAGIYSSTVTIALIINVMQGGFATFWSGFMFANYRTEQKMAQRVHDFFMIGVYVLFIGLLIFKDIVFILVGKRFQVGKDFFTLLLIYPLIILVMETTVYGISIAKKTYVTMIAYLIFFGSNVGLCFVLIPFLGIRGAALASSLAAFVLFIIQTTVGQKYYSTITKKGRTFITLVFVEILAIIDTFCGRGLLEGFLLFGMTLYLFYVYRRELKYILLESKKLVVKG